MIASEQTFWNFVNHRQHAWLRKRDGSFPYSDDPAIARYHFTNVYRELDRGTIWFQQHHGGDPLPAAIVYRPLNRISTFELPGVKTGWNGQIPTRRLKRFFNIVCAASRDGQQVFTGRHLNRGLEYYGRTLDALDPRRLPKLRKEIENCRSLREVISTLKRIPGIGDFFAWQITCDLMESGMLGRCEDRARWAHLGPGALIGLRLVFGLAKNPTRREADELVTRLAASPLNMIDVRWVPPYLPPFLSVKNIEHALCEYGRWIRAHNGIEAGNTHIGLERKPWSKSS